jgi:hypothetical protein
MKILIIDIDSKIPNIALKKIEKYYTDKNYNVEWNNPLGKYNSDLIYVSSIFTKNKWKCEEWEGIAEIGGSGYDIKKRLPDEIEKIKPKINFGFTTRGCIRKCPFCIVHEKEGDIRIEGDIYDIWDGKSKNIVLLDNNILAIPEHFMLICKQLKKEKLKIDFNQGLDHRLITDRLAKELLSLEHLKEIRFAFDNVSYKNTVLEALKILKYNGLKDWGSRWYIYIGEKDTFDTVFERMKILHDEKQAVYIMRDEKIYNKPEFVALASLGNTIGAFKYNLKEVINKSKRLEKYKYLFDKEQKQNVGNPIGTLFEDKK